MMSDASSPRDPDHAPTPDDGLIKRIAALDDYVAGSGSRADLEAAAAADVDPHKLTDLVDTLLLLRQSAAADGALPALLPLEAPRRLGRYAITGKAGEGGFATVWEAFDPLLRRRVALKMLRPESLISATARRRFIREAEIASRLVHPHIVTIYEVGTDEGREFIAQEFCAGGTLAAWLASHPGPLAPRIAARIVLALARAVAYAHGEGVIHRDIKPANIVLSLVAGRATDEPLMPRAGDAEPPYCIVKLADFGLGKLADDDSDNPLTRLTRSGTSMGTPAWMAPEQIDPSLGAVGPATDVHSLGLVLDRLITGRVLRGGSTTAETYRQVLFDDVPSADTVARGVPRDLAAVCLACLARRPADRYATAANLADDLARWLEHRPTAARPLSPAGRAARSIMRRPWLVALAGGILVSSLAAGWATWERARVAGLARERQAALVRRDAAAEMRRSFEAVRAGNVAGALSHLEATRRLDPALASSLAGGWLMRRVHGEREIVVSPPPGTPAGQPRDLYSVTISPDGRSAAVAGADGGLRLIDRLDDGPGRSVVTVIQAHDEINDVSFSADGTHLATVGQDGVAKWWRRDATGLTAIGAARPADGALYAVAFTAGGDALAIGGEDRTIWLVPLAAGGQPRQLVEFEPPPGTSPEIESLVTLPAGLLAASCGDTVTVIDPVGGKVIRELEQLSRVNRKSVLGSLTVSPDGLRLMACGTDAQAHVWDIATGKLLLSLPDHPAWVQGCGFSPDGATLATGCRDGGIRIFAAESGRLLARFVGHVGRVWAVAFEPTGTLLSAGADGTVRRWDLRRSPTTALVREFDVPDQQLERLRPGPALATTPASRSVLAVSRAGSIWQVDLGEGVARRLALPDPGVFDIDYDIARLRLARSHLERIPLAIETFADDVAATPGTVPLPEKASPAKALVAWLPDGQLVVAIGSGTLYSLSADLGSSLPIAHLEDPVHAIVAAPAGKSRIAAAGRRTAVVPLPRGSGPVPRPLFIEIGEDSSACAWSPDGSTVAFGTRTGRVLLFDSRSGAPQGLLTAHERMIECLAFSQDGRVLIAADKDCIRISDVAALTTFDEFRPEWQILGMLVLPEDAGIVIAGGDSQARLAVAEFSAL